MKLVTFTHPFCTCHGLKLQQTVLVTSPQFLFFVQQLHEGREASEPGLLGEKLHQLAEGHRAGGSWQLRIESKEQSKTRTRIIWCLSSRRSTSTQIKVTKATKHLNNQKIHSSHSRILKIQSSFTPKPIFSTSKRKSDEFSSDGFNFGNLRSAKRNEGMFFQLEVGSSCQPRVALLGKSSDTWPVLVGLPGVFQVSLKGPWK